MNMHLPTIETLPTLTLQQEAAITFAAQVDGLLDSLPINVAAMVDLQYPLGGDAHPGIMYKGQADYPDHDGKLEVGINDRGQRTITLSLASGKKIGRPHFAMSVNEASKEAEAARYDALQVVLDPNAEAPIALLGLDLRSDSQPSVLSGIFPRDLRQFTEVCLKAAKDKLRDKVAAHTAGHISTNSYVNSGV